MTMERNIRKQLGMLELHRQAVQSLLRKIADPGDWMCVPINVLLHLTEKRIRIAMCKEFLRVCGVDVDHHLQDYAMPNVCAMLRDVNDLNESLKMPGLPKAARQTIELQLNEARKRFSALGLQNEIECIKVIRDLDLNADKHEYGNGLGLMNSVINLWGESSAGSVIGINYGPIYQYYGVHLPEEGKILLDHYLDTLGKDCEYLYVSHIIGKYQTGTEKPVFPMLRLQEIYMSLTTDGPEVTLRSLERTFAQGQRLLRRLNRERSPYKVPPEQVRRVRIINNTLMSVSQEQRYLPSANYMLLEQYSPDVSCTLMITRPELVLEAIEKQQKLVLLGEPGSGKSTLLRYLALLLVRRLRGLTEHIPGWPDNLCPIPIICSLRQIVEMLPAYNGNAYQALTAMLRNLLEGENESRFGLWHHLLPMMRNGKVILLCDGLDEISVTAANGQPSPRAVVAQAIRHLVKETGIRIVVTSRALPYHTPGDWQLPIEEGWQTRTIMHLDFGQVREFVEKWYTELVFSGYDPNFRFEESRNCIIDLINDLEVSSDLRSVVTTPLLLTMLAIQHHRAEVKSIRSNRSELYEECVQLLLERWLRVRTLGQKRAGLLDLLGNLKGLKLEMLREQINQLAFEAHEMPPGEDGRGLIDRDRLENRMRRFFRKLDSPDASGAVDTLLQVLREDAGLLLERGDGQYMLPHLTFQEYLAACYLADHPEMGDLVEKYWRGPDGDRWREVLRLLAGRLRQQGKVHDKFVLWLQRLLASRLGLSAISKSPAERRRDAVLALLVYRELGPAALTMSPINVEENIEIPMRDVLIDLWSVSEPAVLMTDRLQAGQLLGELSYPYIPVSIDSWKNMLHKLRLNDTNGYFCYVNSGVYWIGSVDDDTEAQEQEKPQHQVTFDTPFWIGRYPITNAQWQEWVAAGGEQSYFAKDTNLNRPNQPVVGVTWEMAVAFCAWLSKQIGVEVRLPSEAEWEAAARGVEGWRYPWGNEWVAGWAATEEDMEPRNWRSTVPVGCYLADRARCGAFDMVGNVWEWTTDAWQSYPGIEKPFADEHRRVLRGGSFAESRVSARCGARISLPFTNFNSRSGLRVIVVLNSR